MRSSFSRTGSPDDHPDRRIGACHPVFLEAAVLYRDETAARTTWHIPEAHYLESWSDARAYDGTVTILQPLIAPLYQGRSALEIAATLAGKGQASAHALVREYWKGQNRAGDFEAFWETALHDGSVQLRIGEIREPEPRRAFTPRHDARPVATRSEADRDGEWPSHPIRESAFCRSASKSRILSTDSEAHSVPRPADSQ